MLVDTSFEPTDKQQNALYALTDKYAKEIEWTAEEPSLDFYDHVPNWERLEKLHGRTIKAVEGWDTVNLKIKQKRWKGLGRIHAVKSVEKDGLIVFARDKFSDGMRSFIKVSGNELNAHAAIRFVIEASVILKDQIISLNDEGEALYCPVLIKNGLMKPDKDRLRDLIQYWNEPKNYEALHGKYPDVTLKEKYFNELLLNRFSFGDPNQFIRQIKPESYLNKRKKFKTTILNVEDSGNLQNFVGDFLSNEQAESESYYDDIKYFPTDILKRQRLNKKKKT